MRLAYTFLAVVVGSNALVDFGRRIYQNESTFNEARDVRTELYPEFAPYSTWAEHQTARSERNRRPKPIQVYDSYEDFKDGQAN